MFDEYEILKLEKKLLKPNIRKSKSDLEQLLADDFIEFGSSGRIYNKNETLNHLQAEIPILRILTDFKASLLAADVCLVTYKITEPESKRCSLRSSIWKLYNDSWKLFFHQGTLQK